MCCKQRGSSKGDAENSFEPMNVTHIIPKTSLTVPMPSLNSSPSFEIRISSLSVMGINKLLFFCSIFSFEQGCFWSSFSWCLRTFETRPQATDNFFEVQIDFDLGICVDVDILFLPPKDGNSVEVSISCICVDVDILFLPLKDGNSVEVSISCSG